MILSLVFITIGLVLLAKGADYLIEGAVGLSKRVGVSELFTGLTLVAFGTSAPELFVGVSATIQGSGIAMGNVLGSNVSNVALILGLAILIKPAPINKSTISYEIPFLILISTVITAMLFENPAITIWDGIILLTFMVIFIAYLYTMAKSDKKIREQILSEIDEVEETDHMSWGKIAFLSLLGIGMLAGGGELTVRYSIEFARILGMSEALISVTIVAFGTSLPELVTAITASRKNTNDILVGNIIGSNVFNILTILGISSLFGTISPDRSLSFDAIFGVIIVVGLLIGILLNKKRNAGRLLGAILVSSYIFYIGYNIFLG
ncbi:calcium/sodium antiporter [Geotoga petraea]|uniref:Calcium/sodium antiporter n=1 Tax=Geotoga petraea TaxID=28234 RepID=A0A1G6PUD8_9BACT|nr:calcium/sodium antiporter [Geotoga petraea]TGG86883.1 calcium/sodium antiporter [Geotoga petraea]SDC83136.1 cation:H+ antiporter [Geotoga petraea]